MREEQSRRQQFTQGSLSTMLPPSVVSGKQGSLLLQEEANNAIAIDMEPTMNHQLMQHAMQDDTVSVMVTYAKKFKTSNNKYVCLIFKGCLCAIES